MPAPARRCWRKRIADDADGEVLFAAFTGKAAQVMRNRGCANARTLHSLIYRPRGEKPEKETGELQPAFALNRASEVAQGAARRRRRVLDGRRKARPRSPLLRHQGAGARRSRPAAAGEERGGRRRLLHRRRARRHADRNPSPGARQPDHRARRRRCAKAAGPTTAATATAASSPATTSTPTRCSPPTRCWSAATARARTSTAASAR